MPCAKVKPPGGDSLGYHSEKASEAESGPGGNKWSDCFVTSVSLCCILLFCAQALGHPDRMAAQTGGPFLYLTMPGG